MEKTRNKSTVIRWGIIGCGNVTEIKSGPAFQKTERFEVKAVMRRNLEKVKDFANRHDIEKYYTDADELINDGEIDAVYIATPPDTHLLYALKVAEANKICCIEKPMAPCYKDCKAIYEAFNKKSIPLFVAYYRRSLPRFEQINTWVKTKEIGEIRHVNWVLSKKPSEKDLSGKYNWRTDVKVAPGGYFDDLASHGLDLFMHFFGEIKQVNGISLNQQQLYLAKDALVACWIHEDGTTGAGTWNFGTDTNEDRVEIFGSKGKMEFSVFEERALVLSQGDHKQELFIENPKHVQLHHVENMRKQLFEDNYEHPSNGYSAMHTSWVMDKIIGQNIQ